MIMARNFGITRPPVDGVVNSRAIGLFIRALKDIGAVLFWLLLAFVSTVGTAAAVYLLISPIL